MLNFEGLTINGAIFDMDGTMFDTERLRLQTIKQASLELCGQQFSDHYLMSCLGLSAKTAQQLAIQHYGDAVDYAAIRAYADQLELAHVRKFGVPVKQGLVETLEKLRKSGLRMAVATSSKRVIAEEYLINANVYKYFDVVVCGDDVLQGKPHPEIFQLAASRLNVPAENCLMFEDSENGLNAAAAAQGQTILLKDIKQPNQQMLETTTFYYENLEQFVQNLNLYINKFDMPNPLERFPQAFNQCKVAIHGFGAIGGGYLAQIFSHWDGYTRPQKIFATTSNSLYMQSIQAFGKYSIRYNHESYDEIIDNIEIVDSAQLDAVINMYLQSSIVALCLPEQAIPDVSPTIAQALLARHLAGMEPLTFMIVLNKVSAKHYVLDAIQQALLQLSSEEIAAQIMAHNYFADTVVNRMVSKLSDKALYRQLRIKYNLFQQYQASHLDDERVDIEDNHSLTEAQAKFMSQTIAELKQNFQPSHVLQSLELILFHSETDMPIYVENVSPVLASLRQAVCVDEIAQIQIVKNRLWNGLHSIIAWYGDLLGYESIGIAMGDARIQSLVNTLLHQEVGPGLTKQYPNLHAIIPQLKQSFWESCSLAFKDPCRRVARDPIRKLQLNDRVFGSIQMNIQYGITHEALLFGAALGIVYAMRTTEGQDQQAYTLSQALAIGQSLNHALQHDQQQLCIAKAHYLNVIAKLQKMIQAYSRQPEEFLKDYKVVKKIQSA